MNYPNQQQALRQQLLARLRPFASPATGVGGQPGMHHHGSQVFTYCCFAAERIAAFEPPHAVIGIVIRGAKEFWIGDHGNRYTAGHVFILPKNIKVDVVNIPDEKHGLYESLCVQVLDVPPALAISETPAGDRRHFDGEVKLTSALVDALSHAALTLADSDQAEAIARHRLNEVLLLLRNDPAARPLFDLTLIECVTRMIAADPTSDWTAQRIAQKIGVGASTLRRRLTRNGTSLREVLAGARMRVARNLLESGQANISSAAEAAGYSSRSHFVRRYRSIFGAAPSEHRAR